MTTSSNQSQPCPDCESGSFALDRRHFLKTTGAAVAGASLLPAVARASETEKPAPETHAKKLFDSLSDEQRRVVAFDWDHEVKGGTTGPGQGGAGLLRTFVSNNWQITRPTIHSDFYTKDQQELIRAIFEGVYNPEWIPKIEKQLQDDAGGYGRSQAIALFGKPGEKFEFVMTGRHLTIRCDGNSAEHVAFGGPIFYGHQATRVEGLQEKDGHPGNVFWPQGLAANKVFEMLDGAQRKAALLARRPEESAVEFRGQDGDFPGIRVKDLAADQKEELQKVLKLLLEPYRHADQSEALECLKKQGGLDACSLAFYSAGDMGDDGVWDNWRLEGPSFVWYFRGEPHVHVWVNIADDPSVKLNAIG